MDSFILIGNQEQTEHYIQEFIAVHSILSYYIDRFSTSLKIADVRNIKQKVSVKLGKNEVRLIVIESDITTEAQNALLKLLEEPPPYVFILICTPSRDSLLSTIISRCQVILLAKEDVVSSTIDMSIFKELSAAPKISYPLLYSLTSNFNMFSSMEDVDVCLLSFRAFIIECLKTEKSVSPDLVIVFTKFCEYYSLIKSNNINRRLTIENLMSE